jgi:hypothetical protein
MTVKRVSMIRSAGFGTRRCMRGAMRGLAGALGIALLASCGGNDSGALTLNITAASPPAGTTGQTYPGYTFMASGGAPPLSWTESGSLPPGLTLSASGQLSGTPANASTYALSVIVSDSSTPPLTASTPVSLKINDSSIVVATTTPPSGTVTYPYPRFAFSASGGSPPYTWKASEMLPPGLMLGSDGTVSGIPTQAGSFSFSIIATDSAQPPMSGAPLATQIDIKTPGSFTDTGGTTLARSGHAATLLLSGEVLVTGGGNGIADPTAELYDPATGTFSSTTGNMTEARSGHTATLLKLSNPAATNYGKVLIVGSVDTSAELYDPSTGTFAATGSLHHPRTSPTATLLNTGKVLIVGGNTTSGDLVAEMYDPAVGTFSDTGSTTTLRIGHTATLLLNGQVLIAGGGATAELYNPTSGTFTPTVGEMTEPRSGQTATLLAARDGAQDGYVLIIGTDGTADLYNPATEAFEHVGSLVPPGQPWIRHTASLRSDGTVLAAGGYFGQWWHDTLQSRQDAALFAPLSNAFTVTGSLGHSRDSHTATVLQDGTVIIIGGLERYPEGCHFVCTQVTVVLSSAELFR